MGFKPEATIYNLRFQDAGYSGLVVKMRSMSLGRLSVFIRQPIDKQDPSKTMEVFDFFASKIIEWNVEHPEIDNPKKIEEEGKPTRYDFSQCDHCGLREDDPIPTIGENILCLDIAFISRIMTVWAEAVASVSLPKEMNTKIGDETERQLALLRAEELPTLDFQNH